MDKHLLRGTLFALLIALLLNVSIFLIANLLAPESRFFDSLVELNLASVLLYTALAVIVAAVLLWLLGRLMENPGTLFLWLVLVASLLSLLLPYNRAFNSWTFGAWGLMHVAVAASIAYGLILPERSR